MTAISVLSAEQIEYKLLYEALATELVAGICDYSDLTGRYGLTLHTIERIRSDPEFKAELERQAPLWLGPENAKKRIQLKAALSIEHTLLELHTIATTATDRTDRLNAIKQLSKIAGTEHKDSDANTAGGGFSVVINYGNGEQMNITQAPVIEHTDTPSINADLRNGIENYEGG